MFQGSYALGQVTACPSTYVVQKNCIGVDETCSPSGTTADLPPNGTVCHALTTWEGQENCYFESTSNSDFPSTDDSNATVYASLADCTASTNGMRNPSGYFWRPPGFATPADCSAGFTVPKNGIYFSFPSNTELQYPYQDGTQPAQCAPLGGGPFYVRWGGITAYKALSCVYSCSY